MEQKINEIEINGVTYVPKDSILSMAPQLDGMEYCMVRTYSAGVFAGYLESRDGKEAVLRNARRIWKWAGATDLSQLANLTLKELERPASMQYARIYDRVWEMCPIRLRLAGESRRKENAAGRERLARRILLE